MEGGGPNHLRATQVFLDTLDFFEKTLLELLRVYGRVAREIVGREYLGTVPLKIDFRGPDLESLVLGLE